MEDDTTRVDAQGVEGVDHEPNVAHVVGGHTEQELKTILARMETQQSEIKEQLKDMQAKSGRAEVPKADFGAYFRDFLPKKK